MPRIPIRIIASFLSVSSVVPGAGAEQKGNRAVPVRGFRDHRGGNPLAGTLGGPRTSTDFNATGTFRR
ncbi:MAG: hypothetical protein D6725_14230 [Planctomycetota bacterium]|nr:MAG: hypothetical protein D6725_14230 [Planctomycetota bacterium]